MLYEEVCRAVATEDKSLLRQVGDSAWLCCSTCPAHTCRDPAMLMDWQGHCWPQPRCMPSRSHALPGPPDPVCKSNAQ